MTLPTDWMPAASMQRVIVHWTAGTHEASDLDRSHYHVLVEGDGRVVRGAPSIDLNAAPLRPGYAAHTLNCNTGSIGVSMCAMGGAVEEPFDAGRWPLTAAQWDGMLGVVATLADRYAIPPTARTILSHAEVAANLGIAQRGKWDVARLPFRPDVVGARAVGDLMRAEVAARLGSSPAASAPAALPVIRIGANGAAVVRLQMALNRAAGAGLGADGDFGPKTDASVRAFQAAKNLAIDGIVGPSTWAALGA